ncbi:MAG: 4-(cytidine 5'-diphospho)-2-C-methyl-D-erythritol kinase [Zoogloeaceae bacterium]|nr:4-(cytidine 5'-diphospho)-2-C-methyl-D-erythritol kinase [Zoogloeaceae bacterium]
MTHWHWKSAWPAPAKLNLFLHVVGRRPDGYHLLQTLFRFVDHGDWLHFSPRADGDVVLATPLPGVAPESDLTVRAARLLQAETGCRQGVTISLEKRLPMGGGLGGGSSDAATVLLALNHLWQLGLSRERLQVLGLTLGADVPIFVYGRNAFAEGVGEDFTPLPLPPAWYLVLEPPVQVPTLDIFRSPDLCRETPEISPHSWTPGFGHNDLEKVAVELYPVVAEHLAWLAAFSPARMSGSGACVFAEFASREAAETVLKQLPQGMRGWVASGLSSHPLIALGAP